MKSHASRGATGKLSPEQLDKVAKVSDELLRAVHEGLRPAMQGAAEAIGEVLNVENCSIFLVSRPDTTILELEASANPLWSPKRGERVAIKIGDDPKNSLTGRIVHRGEPLIMDHAQLASVHCAGPGITHLRNGLRYSLLSVPLRGRDEALLGLLKCENKKTRRGVVTPEVEFSETDLEMAKLFAEKLSIIVHLASIGETVNVLNIAENLITHIQQGREGLLHTILSLAVQLLQADRGDFVWWTAKHRDLTYATYFGACLSKDIGEDKPVPRQCFVRSVFENLEEDYRIAFDLYDADERAAHPYLEAHPNTRSELAVRVDMDGNPVGVLNVESFEKAKFDKHDINLLRMIGRHAAVAVHAVQTEGLIRRALEHRDEPETILAPILEALLESNGFGEGILYWADERHQILRVGASRNAEVKFNPREFTQAIDGPPSFASWLFDEAKRLPKESQERVEIIERPWDDVRVNRQALKDWKVDGPLAGFPLVFENKAMGCLVLWRGKRPFPNRVSITRLKDIAHLAAAKLAFWLTEQATKEADERYRQLAENSPLMVCTKLGVPWKPNESKPTGIPEGAPKIVFEYANPAWMKYMGFASTDLRQIAGKTDSEVGFPNDGALKYYQDDLKVLNGNPVLDEDESNVKPNTKLVRHVRVWKTPIYDSSQPPRVVGIQIAFIDRTKRFELEEKNRELLTRQWQLIQEKDHLLQENRRLMEYKDSLWNDLKHRAAGGLRYAGAFLEIQEERFQKQPKLRHVLRDSRLRIQNMELLIRLLYDSSTEDHVEMKPFLTSLVRAVVESYRSSFIPVVRDEAIEDLKFALQDARYCGLIVTELVANSLEHAFEKREMGTVNLQLRFMRDTRSFELIVEDDGCGFQPHSIRRQGRSLGLQIVELLSRAIGGAIDRTAADPGNSEAPGTRFTIRFQPEHRLHQGIESSPNPPPEKRTVLLVEDDPVDAFRCECALRARGFHVYPTVVTKSHAIEACIAKKPDVLVLDVQLGKGSVDRYAGIDIAETIARKHQLPIPMVFLSGKDDDVSKRRISALQAESFIKEGNIIGNLLHHIEVALNRNLKGRKVFICYSSMDDSYRMELQRHLDTLRLADNDLEYWSDERIKPGADWHREIAAAIEASVAAVLLLSPDFSRSPFIQEFELPPLLYMAQRRSTVILPVMIAHCCLLTKGGHDLSKWEFCGDTQKSPIGLITNKARRDRIWDQIRQAISNKLSTLQGQRQANCN